MKLLKNFQRSKRLILEIAESCEFSHPYLTRLRGEKIHHRNLSKAHWELIYSCVKVLSSRLGYEVLLGETRSVELSKLAQVTRCIRCNRIPK